MNMHFEELLDKVTTFMEHEAKTETIIGNQFALGEFTCLPVIRVGMGFGTGGGEGDELKKVHGEGIGAGGGMGLEPIGFLVTKGEQIEFLSTKTNKGLAAAFEKVPELINKYMDIRAERPEPVLS